MTETKKCPYCKRELTLRFVWLPLPDLQGPAAICVGCNEGGERLGQVLMEGSLLEA